MKKNNLNIIEPRWFLLFVFFLAGIFLGGISLYILMGLNTRGIFKTHLISADYKYINPVLTVDVSQSFTIFADKSLELGSESLIKKHKDAGNIFSASIYYRDIEPGNWININDSEKFSPGKLLKIPIMIAYYKLAENNPEILNEKITYKISSVENEELFNKQSKLQVGKEYTVDELIKNMIVYSDNFSADLLFDKIEKNYLNEVFSDLNVDFKEEKQTQDFISLKSYSIFFRILYNASYLNREYSEKALSLLVEADDNFGLAAGLPKSTPTANRYGARVYYDKNNQKKIEMYDCNLVYYPNHPYLACAIARGDNLNNLQIFFTELGKKIYDETYFRYR